VSDDLHLVRTLNMTREHNPVVAICTKNATASGRMGQTAKRAGRNDNRGLPTENQSSGELI